MAGFWVMRVVITALALALAVALIARGNVLIGGLVGALALARLAMFATMWRRRQQFAQRRRERQSQRRDS